MWVLRNTHASGVGLRRRISLLATLLVVAFFAVAGPLVQTAHAEGNATWSGTTLKYNDQSFTETTAAPDVQGMKKEYQWIDTAGTPNNAYVFYFKEDDAQKATTAQLIIYTYTANPLVYTAPSTPSTVQIGAPTGTGDSSESSCSAEYFGGVGWVVCSVSSWIAKGVDGMYQLISNFLKVETISQSDNGVKAMWNMSKDVANVCFIIVFLVIVYSQLTTIGYNNYNIKDMIPRLIIASIAVNVSFIICALFVDISNVLGVSIDLLFKGIRDSLKLSVEISWSDITTLILSGGTAAVGTLAFAASAAGSWAALGFIILGTLISAGMSLLAAFIILAARQALIVVLVIISPLAFVAMVLPSTKGLFTKWRKAFTALLIFFPIFALLFGGSQLAGIAIINSQYHVANPQISIVLIGLAVQVIPLAITPMIMKFADGIFGQISGIVNNKQRGIADRARNWSRDNADLHAAQKKDKVAADIEAGRNRGLRARGVGRLGLAMDQGARKRKATIGDIDKSLENRMEASRQRRISERSNGYGRKMYETAMRSHEYHERAELYKGSVEAASNEHWAHTLDHDTNLKAVKRQTARANRRAEIITKDLEAKDKRAVEHMVSNDAILRARSVSASVAENEAQAYTDSVAAESEERWKNRQNNNGYLRVMRTTTEHTKNRAADIDAAMTAIDQQTYNDAVDAAATPTYARIRTLRTDTHAAKKNAETIEARMTANDQKTWENSINNGASGTYEGRVRQARIDTIADNKEAETIANTIQSQGNAHWQYISRTQPELQNLRLQETKAADKARLVESQFNKLVEDARAKGAAAPNLAMGNESVANSLMGLTEDIAVEENAINEAKLAQSQNLAKAYRQSQKSEDKVLLRRAAGVGGDDGMLRTYSKAWKQLVSEATGDVDTARSITSDLTRDQLKTLLYEDTSATAAMRQAALYELLQKKGNNEDAQEIRDAVAEMGMLTDGEGNFYEPLREPETGRVIRNAAGYPEFDPNRNTLITDADEISRRRDWQQFFDDAMSKSPHSMITNSGTNGSEFRAGTSVDDTRQAFVRDALGGKFGPSKFEKADIDELKILLADMRDPKGEYQRLDETKKKEMDTAILNAIHGLQNDITLNGKIDDRNRGVMNEIAAQINPAYISGHDPDTGRPIFNVNADNKNALLAPDADLSSVRLAKFTAPISVPDNQYTKHSIRLN